MDLPQIVVADPRDRLVDERRGDEWLGALHLHQLIYQYRLNGFGADW